MRWFPRALSISLCLSPPLSLSSILLSFWPLVRSVLVLMPAGHWARVNCCGRSALCFSTVYWELGDWGVERYRSSSPIDSTRSKYSLPPCPTEPLVPTINRPSAPRLRASTGTHQRQASWEAPHKTAGQVLSCPVLFLFFFKN